MATQTWRGLGRRLLDVEHGDNKATRTCTLWVCKGDALECLAWCKCRLRLCGV